MVAAYYTTYYLTLYFVPWSLLTFWIICALIVPIYSLFIHHARQNTIVSMLIMSIPIALLMQRGQYLLSDWVRDSTVDIVILFNVLSALLIFILLSRGLKNKLILFVLSALFFYLFEFLYVFQYLPF